MLPKREYWSTVEVVSYLRRLPLPFAPLARWLACVGDKRFGVVIRSTIYRTLGLSVKPEPSSPTVCNFIQLHSYQLDDRDI